MRPETNIENDSPSTHRGRRLRFLGIVACVSVIGALALAAQASADIYWTSPGAGTISRANGEGGEVDANFISGLAEPFAVAVDQNYIYWTAPGSESIGRAKIDGSEVQPELIAGIEAADGIALDAGHIYWTTEGTESVERSNLSGGEIELVSRASEPRAIAVVGGRVYWTENKKVSRAAVDGTEIERPYVSLPSLAHGLAADKGNLYVGLDQEGRIARIPLATGALDPAFITGASVPVGIAVDADHVYWGSGFGGNQAIGRAAIDGSGVDNTFIQGTAGEIVGVAVTPSPEPEPTPTPSTSRVAPVAALTGVASAKAGTLRLIKLRRNRNAGLGRLRIHAPAAGSVTVFGKGVKRATRRYTAASDAYLKVMPKGAYKARLLAHHRGYTKVKIRFVGSDGTVGTLTRRMRLVRR